MYCADGHISRSVIFRMTSLIHLEYSSEHWVATLRLPISCSLKTDYQFHGSRHLPDEPLAEEKESELLALWAAALRIYSCDAIGLNKGRRDAGYQAYFWSLSIQISVSISVIQGGCYILQIHILPGIYLAGAWLSMLNLSCISGRILARCRENELMDVVDCVWHPCASSSTL
jgi:hypothetical protein